MSFSIRLLVRSETIRGQSAYSRALRCMACFNYRIVLSAQSSKTEICTSVARPLGFREHRSSYEWLSEYHLRIVFMVQCCRKDCNLHCRKGPRPLSGGLVLGILPCRRSRCRSYLARGIREGTRHQISHVEKGRENSVFTSRMSIKVEISWHIVN